MKLKRMVFLKSYLSKLTYLFLLISCISCKKYPENTLWCKNPYDYPVVHGKIIEYKVNGIDSLELLNFYYDTVWINSYHPYNKTIRDVKQEIFDPYRRNKVSRDLLCDLLGDRIGSVYWENDKKRVSIFSPNPDYRYFKKNIFIQKNTVWEVVRLEKNGLSKIKNTYNGNTYEITFN